MTKLSQLLGNRSYSVLFLFMLALVLPLTVVLVAAAAPISASGTSRLSLPAGDLTPRSYLPLVAKAPLLPVWTEVARTPGLENGWQPLGHWQRIGQGQGGDAYPGCIAATDPGCIYYPYEPTIGPNANWWTVGYNDSAWSTQGYVDWNTAWTVYGWDPIPTIGEHVWKAAPGWLAGVTDLHRRTFEITEGCAVLDARGTYFSDNTSRWYINGTFVGESEASASRQVSLPATVFHSGSNLLAVQVSNDHVSLIDNPFGIQYILEVQLQCAPAQPVVLTTTATVSATVGQPIHDTAHLSGGTAPLTGTMTFSVYGPDDDSCSTLIAVPPAVTINGAGSYSSGFYTPTVAGAYRWIAHYSGNANNPAVKTPCDDPNEMSSVFTLTLTTNASPIPLGQTIIDTAHLRGGYGTPGGNITFDVFAPNDTACATPIAVPPAVSVNGAGDYASGLYTPTLAGIYRWIAHYSGDGINPAMNTGCADPAEVSNVQPGLALAKISSTTIYTTVGQVVTYTYSITNVGNVTLNGPITVADDRVTVTCPNVGTLLPAASMTCSAAYVVTQADINAGSVTNHATAQGFLGEVPVTSNPAQTTINLASLALVKSASPTIYGLAGEVITYTYTATNSGQATLHGPVMVHDDKLGTFACGPAADLAPGASVTCTRTYVIQQTDLGNVLHWPIQQVTNVTYGEWLGGGNSTTDIILNGNAPGSDVPNGTYAGWCIESTIGGFLYDQLATLYTSTHLNLPADVASLPWGKVNYIINHKIRGIGKTDSEFFKDVQTAIWVVLGEPATWGISYDAQQMIDAANANSSYVPGLTDMVAVIVYSDGINSTGSDLIQEFIIEAKLGQITNHATATATVGGITVISNGVEVTIHFVPLYTTTPISIPNRPAVKSKF